MLLDRSQRPWAWFTPVSAAAVHVPASLLLIIMTGWHAVVVLFLS